MESDSHKVRRHQFEEEECDPLEDTSFGWLTDILLYQGTPLGLGKGGIIVVGGFNL